MICFVGHPFICVTKSLFPSIDCNFYSLPLSPPKIEMHSFCTFVNLSLFLPVIDKSAPNLAKCLAAASPIPLLAPEIIKLRICA